MSRILNNFKDRDDKWVGSFTCYGKQYFTQVYTIWQDMNSRCTKGGYSQSVMPTYIGCSMGDNFKDFQFFAQWYTSQAGYGHKNMQLDKDILVKGNKIYDEHRCCLVPQALNTFLVRSESRTGEYPTGVSYRKNSGYYRAQIRVDGVTRLLGDYTNPALAKQAYDVAKINEALRWVARLENKEFVVDERVIESLRHWQPT